MEQSVWLYVGIIIALIGLGFVASIVVSGRETSKQQSIESSLKKMQQNCNLVCAADTQTMFKVDIVFVSGMKLYSLEKAICIDFKAGSNCQKCDCKVMAKDGSALLMDYSSEEAMQLFETANFECFMERVDTGVAVECKG